MSTIPIVTSPPGTALSAFSAAKANPNRSIAKWVQAFDGLANVGHVSRFQFSKSAKIFTIGSCFARNVETHLRNQGLNLLSEFPLLPADHYKREGSDRTGYQNVYTPGSVLEAIRLCSRDDPQHSIFQDGDQSFDLLVSGLQPLPLETVLRVRAGLLDTYRRLGEADILIVTLGYNESWSYRPHNSYINRAPSAAGLRRRIDDFEFGVMGYEEARQALAAAFGIVRRMAPGCKVILTVSPVAMGATFTAKDIVVANQQSKSTLVAVATSLRDQFDFIDYFPSYEIVVNSDRSRVFEEDGAHIQSESVSAIMKLFMSSYVTTA